MYAKSVSIYDKLYAKKDYEKEAALIVSLATARNPGAKTLLDVACGTGKHLLYLKRAYRAEGVDISRGFVQIARQANPDLRFEVADMVGMRLHRTFDVVTCLFSAIGFVRTHARLRRAIRSLADHLGSGGLLFVEPWFPPDQWHPHKPHATFVDEPELKIARLTTSEQAGSCSVQDLHYVVATPQSTTHFVERFVQGLFTREQMTSAFRDAGLVTEYDEAGLTGRGLYIGRRN
jgi:SAM-dependent methyltransferase